MSPRTKRRPGGTGSSVAAASIDSERSTATTSKPASAIARACSPGPQPTSSTRREGAEDSTSSISGHSRRIRSGQAISRR
jgi:hypothetical protein